MREFKKGRFPPNPSLRDLNSLFNKVTREKVEGDYNGLIDDILHICCIYKPLVRNDPEWKSKGGASSELKSRKYELDSSSSDPTSLYLFPYIK